MQPLDGLVVVDFSTLLPGPMASLILAEAGAEVIKIERPGVGDEARLFPGKLGDEGVMFALLNRGKESVAIDLKSQDGRAALEPHLARADIVIEQFRPGVMDRLGLGYTDLSKRYPNLIYCSISGYGQDGPMARAAGHDLNYIAQSGLLSLGMGPVHAPTVPPALIADIAGGTYPAVMNILLALEARRKTGRGTHIDVSMTDNMFPIMWWALAQRAATGQSPGNADALLSGGSPRYRLYPTKDNKALAVGALEDRFWSKFCAAIALDEDLTDDRQAQAKTIAGVADLIAAQDSTHWRAVFEQVDCCCCIVETLEDAMQNPHFHARGLFTAQLPIADTEIAALPMPISPAFRSTRPRRAPKLGEHGNV